MAALTEWYVVRFKGANGRARYVGDDATMPFTEAEARIFRDKREAKAAFDRIGPHHKAEGAKPSILPRKGVIAFPVVATMLGVDQ